VGNFRTFIEARRVEALASRSGTARRAGSPSAFKPSNSGLIVPTRLAGSPSSLDLMHTYLVASDVTGHTHAFAQAMEILGRFSTEFTLVWVSQQLRGWTQMSGSWQREQRRVASRVFDSTSRSGSRAIELVRSGRRSLFAPQVLLMVAKLALLYGHTGLAADEPSDSKVSDLLTAMLITAEHMTASEADLFKLTGRSKRGRSITLDADLAANQLLHRQTYPPSLIARYHARWKRLPDTLRTHRAFVDIEAEFDAAVGCTIDEFTAVGIMLWGVYQEHQVPMVGRAALAMPGTPGDHVDAALKATSATPSEMLESLRDVEKVANQNPLYAFESFRQYPVIELGGKQYLVLSDALLLNRFFGWLRNLDVIENVRPNKRRSRVKQFFEAAAEAQAVERLPRIAASSFGGGVCYGEEDIQRAFGTATPNADAAVSFGRRWLVLEVSSRVASMSTRTATESASILDDIDKGIVAKARQVQSTINSLREDFQAIDETLGPASSPLRFYPVLVICDGFPINPMTKKLISQSLVAASLFAETDTASLTIVDTETLEVLESVCRAVTDPVPTLIEAFHRSGLATSSFRDWLTATYPESSRAPDDVQAEFNTAVEAVVSMLE